MRELITTTMANNGTTGFSYGREIIMNTEKVTLAMTSAEADSIAYVLQTALHTVTMLDRERKDTTHAANALFTQLGYGHCTNEQGERVELKP